MTWRGVAQATYLGPSYNKPSRLKSAGAYDVWTLPTLDYKVPYDGANAAVKVG